MSVSTSIQFLKDKNYHEEMCIVVRSLMKLKVKKLPKELAEYFKTEEVADALKDDGDLLLVDSIYDLYDGRLPSYVTRTDTEYSNAVQIDVDKLPASVKHIVVSRS